MNNDDVQSHAKIRILQINPTKHKCKWLIVELPIPQSQTQMLKVCAMYIATLFVV